MRRHRTLPSVAQTDMFRPVFAQFTLGITVTAVEREYSRERALEEQRIDRLYKESARQARRDFEKILGPLTPAIEKGEQPDERSIAWQIPQ